MFKFNHRDVEMAAMDVLDEHPKGLELKELVKRVRDVADSKAVKHASDQAIADAINDATENYFLFTRVDGVYTRCKQQQTLMRQKTQTCRKNILTVLKFAPFAESVLFVEVSKMDKVGAVLFARTLNELQDEKIIARKDNLVQIVRAKTDLEKENESLRQQLQAQERIIQKLKNPIKHDALF